MKWFLIFQAVTTWPASPPQLQIQGPFDTKDLCEQVRDQLPEFRLVSKCISVPTLPPVAK